MIVPVMERLRCPPSNTADNRTADVLTMLELEGEKGKAEAVLST
jgi:hypothetical protein